MKWTKIEEDKLKEMVDFGYTTEEIALKLKRSYKAVQHRRAKLTRGKPVYIKKVETDNRTFTQKNKDLLYELKSQIKQVSPMEINNKSFSKSGDTLIIHFTDWHVGRIVKDEFGNEIYNTGIFKERINTLLTELLKLLDEYIRKGTPIKDVAIISTGDILDGMGIFATQETQSEMSPPFQVMLAVEVIQKFILALLKRKLTVNMYCVRGNHGEIRGERGKTKDVNANWDIQLYLILSFWVDSMLKKNKVKIFYSELDYLNFEVQGWKYHIRHIAPQQSETSAGKAKFLGWARKHDSDVIVSGHYHHYSIADRSGVTVIKGGSVTGADEYSEQLAEEADPIQLIWGCSKHRPLTFMYAIDVGKRKRK